MDQEQKNNYTFGELLMGFRRRENMSRAALALQLEGKVSASAIRDWERAEYLPKELEIVEELARVLGLDARDAQQLINASRPTAIIDFKVHDDFKRSHLQDLLPDIRDLQQKYLDRIVGREKELATIQAEIERLRPTGGFLTVTGPAGQGKSYILAKLIEKIGGSEQIAYHFIPYMLGDQRQVEVLQSLIARLATKYNFKDIDMENTNLALLRSIFHQLLKRIVKSGFQEILVIDGLDQLKRESDGWRDLSFLLPDPPSGVIFVLGTRPDDTLKPLSLVKPQIEYSLPPMNCPDFTMLLQQQDIYLRHTLVERYHTALGGHAFYLDLAVRILAEKGTLAPEKLITQIENNPDNLLWLSLERLKKPEEEWRVVLKPVLGVLLHAHEPLSASALSDILDVEEERISEGLLRLGGLVKQDGRHRSTLFHSKLYDYLRYDIGKLTHTSLFSHKEERYWHRLLANWCEQKSFTTVWEKTEDEREQEHRAYTWQHCVVHLSKAQEWQRLFSVLDTNQYGQTKIHQFDPSTRTYAYDLEIGKQAVIDAEETFEGALKQLPRLWHYTLLRCNLANRADWYPVNAFGFLVHLNGLQEALGRAELVNEPTKQINIFCEIATQVREQTPSSEKSVAVLQRAEEIVESAGKTIETAVLRKLGTALTQASLWEEAEHICRSITSETEQGRALQELSGALAQAGIWEEAERVCRSIADDKLQTDALAQLSVFFVQAGIWEEAERVCHTIPDTITIELVEALNTVSLALFQAGKRKSAEDIWKKVEYICSSIYHKEERANALVELSSSLTQAGIWAAAGRICYAIPNKMVVERVESFSKLGLALVKAGKRKPAEHIWKEAERICRTSPDKQAYALSILSSALVQASLWKEAESICATIPGEMQRASALAELSSALAHAGIWAEAERICYSIPNKEWGSRGNALIALSTVQAQAGLWKEAEHICDTINAIWYKAEALRELGLVLVKAGKRKQAKHIWEKIVNIYLKFSDKENQVEGMSKLSLALISAGVWEEAERACHCIPDKQERAEILSKLGLALVKAGERNWARRIWNEIKHAYRPISDAKERAAALTELGTAFVQIAEREQARQLWDETKRICLTISDDWTRDAALYRLGSALNKAEMWEEAEQVYWCLSNEARRADALCWLATCLARASLWKEARGICGRIPCEEIRIEALRQLSAALSQAGIWEEAEHVCRSVPEVGRTWALGELSSSLALAGKWEEAEHVCHSIPEEKRAWSLISLGSAFVKVGKRKQAKLVWEEAERVLSYIPDIWTQAGALKDLSIALAQAGAWKEAKRICDTIPYLGHQAEALIELGLVLSKAQERELAKHVWKEAEHVCRSVPYEINKTEALRKLSAALTEASAWEKAERICLSIPRAKQCETLSELSAVLAQASMWEEAERICLSISDAATQVEALYKLGVTLSQAGKQKQTKLIWQRAERICLGISNTITQAKVLQELSIALAQAGAWEEAERICLSLPHQAKALSELSAALAQANMWKEAERVCYLLKGEDRAESSRKLGQIALEKGDSMLALHFVQQTWCSVEIQADAFQSFTQSVPLLVTQPSLVFASYDKFLWVDQFFE